MAYRCGYQILEYTYPKARYFHTNQRALIQDASLDHQLQCLCKEENLERALEVLVRVDELGISISPELYFCLLKSCQKRKALAHATQIFDHITKHRSVDQFCGPLADCFVLTFGKCGAIREAHNLFCELSHRSVFSWMSLMSAYLENGQGNDTLILLERMQNDGVEPNQCTFISLFKACGIILDIRKGRKLHVLAKEKGIICDAYVVNTLVGMYAKCGSLIEARKLFDELKIRNVVTWNALISAYTQHGLDGESLQCFKHMQEDGISPNAVTFICVLKACSRIGFLEMGEEIHKEVLNRGFLERNVALGTTLLDMYAKCGMIEKARSVFHELPVRNVVSYGALISGYAQHGRGHEALNFYMQMQNEGVSPDTGIFVCVLKACGIIGCVEIGEAIHAKVRKEGLLGRSVNLGTALVDMYAKCNMLEKAQEVFDEIPLRDVATWSALISAYTEHGFNETAIKCFRQMRDRGLFPNTITFTCVLKACRSIQFLHVGEEIHFEVSKLGLLEKDIVLGTTLVDMYAKCSMMAKAQEVFDEILVRNVASWNALIIGYAQHGHGHDSLRCFKQMQDEGLSPDVITFVGILKACGSLGFMERGEEIYMRARSEKLFKKNVVLGTTIVDMYVKCGVLAKAQEFFDELKLEDVICWNALMAGYGQLGQAENVLNLFDRMKVEGTIPNAGTFLVILNACSLAGLVEKGQKMFDDMYSLYHLTPTLEHYNCMVDLFGRVGHFEKAIVMIEKIPYVDRLQLWLTLLSACRKWVNVELGRWAFDQSIELDEKCGVAYVTMGNVYANAGLHKEMDEIEGLRVKNKAWKVSEPCSWTDLHGYVHIFGIQEKDPILSEHVYDKLEDIRQKLLDVGYSPCLHWVLEAVSYEDKNEYMLCGHSEMLAISCALINSPKHMPIQITKKTNVCIDCHVSISIVSKMEKCKIHINDGNHIHIFEHGKCTCKEDFIARPNVDQRFL